MFVDIDAFQHKKHNQNAYGDYFASKRTQGRIIVVLSDGLGSGIKANILSCMTATMLLKFIEAGYDIQKACEIIMNSLPVCKVRKISYSTFSAVDCREDGTALIAEEGNPKFIWTRKGNILDTQAYIVTSKIFLNRQMQIYNIKLEPLDRLIFCSDGATHAGLGTKDLKMGLGRNGVIGFVLNRLCDNPDISSRELSKSAADFALSVEEGKKAKDDISVVSIYMRNPRRALVFTGPPYRDSQDGFYANAFKNFNGKKAICGGTTANVISRELNIPVRSKILFHSGSLPNLMEMDGVDLVTEGILTLTRALEYLEYPPYDTPEDAAGRLVKFFLESDCIDFMVGAKFNPSHYDPSLPVELEIRKNVVKKISKLLEEKYIKKVTLQYI
ncbi:MAG: SpoIIE family protein phosphatase [Endomicrobium sp.]|jgi:serine/threonine protein phosphatase PrpC|nr:SpoIIE family protein phosphatase [Endomicrobium sp.]